MTEDFYDLLDIPPDASQGEVKDAYREQVRVYHPDHNDDERARAQFTAVKKAYDILGNPVERRAYDRLGHETYVAKRTSGLPSPDVWKSSSAKSKSKSTSSKSNESAADDSGTTFTYSDDASTAGEATATGARSRSTAKSAAGATTAGTAAGAGTSTGTATDADGTGSSGPSRTTATGSAGGGTAHGRARGDTSARARTDGRSRTETGRFGDNAAVRWWRRQNVSLPLIWLSVVVYLGGLVHFALENGGPLAALAADLGAVDADPAALRETLTSGRHGVESTLEYLAAFELVAPPLESPLWYAVLAGVVGLTVLGLLVARVASDWEATEPISIDETIVLALALTATTVLVGGPLLAGAVLMPVLFTVIVRHTRRGPGWKPSYLYVVPVLAPLAGFGLAAAGAATDLVAFGLLPIVGGLGLPLRATIRKRFGR